MKTTGIVTGIVSNLVTVLVDGPVAENEICYIDLSGVKMMAEVIKVNGKYASVQVFESTRGLRGGDKVEFEGRMLQVTLGPGLLGEVKEGWLPHKIMVPFSFQGAYTVKSVVPAGQYNIDTVIAVLTGADGEDVNVTMTQKWPVKVAIKGYKEKPRPNRIMETGVRVIDTLNPIAEGGTGFIPGPFGRHRHGGLRRARERGRGNLHRVPGTDRPAHRTPPDGTHHHHLQYLQHAGGRP